MIYTARFYLKIAIDNLLLHKLRMLLALIGILFAVMSLFAFGNISAGMKAKIDDEIEKFGKNILIVRSGLIAVTGRGMRQFAESQNLKMHDANRIKEGIQGVKEVVPFFDVTYPARYRDKSLKINIVAAPQSIFAVRNLNLVAGGIYRAEDERNAEKKIVVGYKIFENLIGSEDPIGKYLLIYRAPTEIVGVIEERGADFTGTDQDIQAYIPLTTFMRRYSNVDYIKGIFVQVEDGLSIEGMKAELSSYIRWLHRLKEGQRDDFTVFTMNDILKTREEGIRLVSILTIIASTISFIIGGLGIFAIMLLSVSERKMEIGIRMVVGSRKRDIIFQFLMESAIIATIGGIFGILIGFVITIGVDLVGQIPFRVEPISLVIAFFACVAVGLLAGIYPAVQSTKFEPVRVLYG